eukprot:1184082-Prorocentrum_minimum.AAC.3
MGDTSELEAAVNKQLTVDDHEDMTPINPDELSDLSSDDEEVKPSPFVQSSTPDLTDAEILDKAAEFFWGDTFSTKFEVRDFSEENVSKADRLFNPQS